MNNISFKFRLNMLITAAFAVGVLSGGMFAVRNYRRAISAETEASAQLVTGLLGATQGLISSPTEAEEFRDRLIHEIPALTELRHVRLEVFDESGKSLIRSPLGAPDGGTRAPRWFTELVSPVPRSYQIPLSRGLGRSGIIVVTTDPHDEVAEEWTNTREPEAAMRELQTAGISAGVARLPVEMLKDPQLHARGFIQDVDRAFIGKHPQPSLPFREGDEPFAIRFAPPTLGEYNEEILGGMLGLSKAELERLANEDIIGTEMLMEEQLTRRKQAAE